MAGFWGLAPRKNILNSHSIERQEMLLCVVGKHVYIIDLYSGMENMTPPSNLHCTKFNSSELDFQKIIILFASLLGQMQE